MLCFAVLMAILVVFIVKTESNEVVEELGKIEECLNGLPQDHPSVIETIQDYYLKKPNKGLKNTRVNDWGMSLHSVSTAFLLQNPLDLLCPKVRKFVF